MTTGEEFKLQIIKSGFSIVNEFLNDNNYLYVILESKWAKGYFIATSNNNWKIMRLHKSGKFAYEEFGFSKKETSTIKKVIDLTEKKNNEEV